MHAILRRASLRRLLRAVTIWRVVIQLLALLWWDGQAWSYRNGVTEDARALRQATRARWLTTELLPKQPPPLQLQPERLQLP